MSTSNTASRHDCRNCGGDGFTTTGPVCPACQGRGWVPDGIRTAPRAVRLAAHLIAEQATVSGISIAEALNAHRLDLGQKLAAAVLTADDFSRQRRPAAWVQGEADAARKYAAELDAIADLTEAEVRVIVALGLRP